ncbi:hypothetical protein PUN28_003992 [Cardiocondyla obscurior]|uniref:Uncharacterized protein n=1 Tax=Cardiocondyla obscurior TaxID=286306 RepID=A0AAW2GP44_9HYME
MLERKRMRRNVICSQQQSFRASSVFFCLGYITRSHPFSHICSSNIFLLYVCIIENRNGKGNIYKSCAHYNAVLTLSDKVL